MFVASTVGALALFKDTLKDFRSRGAAGGELVTCTVRPLFRVLSGLLGIVLTVVALMMIVLLARAVAGAEVIEVWMEWLLVALLVGSAVGGFVCMFAAFLGRPPTWMSPAQQSGAGQAESKANRMKADR